MKEDATPFAGLLGGKAYRPQVLFELPYGTVAAAYYTRDIVPPEALRELHPMERSAAQARPSFGVTQFVAGRIALRCALERAGAASAALAPLVPSQNGAVMPPPGFVASISHKNGVAIAIACRDHGQGVGIDLDSLSPARSALEGRILSAEEARELSATDPDDIWLEVLARFCVKEAAYKAISRFGTCAEIGFKEMSVHISTAVLSKGFQNALVRATAPCASTLRILGAVGLFGSRVVAASVAEPVDRSA